MALFHQLLKHVLIFALCCQDILSNRSALFEVLERCYVFASV